MTITREEYDQILGQMLALEVLLVMVVSLEIGRDKVVAAYLGQQIEDAMMNRRIAEVLVGRGSGGLPEEAREVRQSRERARKCAMSREINRDYAPEPWQCNEIVFDRDPLNGRACKRRKSHPRETDYCWQHGQKREVWFKGFEKAGFGIEG